MCRCAACPSGRTHQMCRCVVKLLSQTAFFPEWSEGGSQSKISPTTLYGGAFDRQRILKALVLFMCVNLKALKSKNLGHEVKTLVRCEGHCLYCLMTEQSAAFVNWPGLSQVNRLIMGYRNGLIWNLNVTASAMDVPECLLFVLKRPWLLPLMPTKVPVPPAKAFSDISLCSRLNCLLFIDALRKKKKLQLCFFSISFPHHKMSPYWSDGPKVQAKHNCGGWLCSLKSS